METVKVIFKVYNKDGTDGYYIRLFKTLSHFLSHIKVIDCKYKIEIHEDNNNLICDCYEYMGILRGDKHGKV